LLTDAVVQRGCVSQDVLDAQMKGWTPPLAPLRMNEIESFTQKKALLTNRLVNEK
jgi:hypothetical protein